MRRADGRGEGGIRRGGGLEAHFDRIDGLWRRHGRTFWILHSIWALATGAAVVWLARERYAFVYWVLGFLGLTWLSTVFFGRLAPADAEAERSVRLRRGVASYLTRVLYQETLFFLLPFYAYSAVVPSWNLAFLALLCVLAVLACLDLLFDRWLRESPVFRLVFFASVTFAAINLLLPMLFSIDPAIATPAAAVAALASAVPLVLQQGGSSLGTWLRLVGAAVAILAVSVWTPQLVPPVPLRLSSVSFSANLDRATLEPLGLVDRVARRSELDDRLVVLARVFAPVNVVTTVTLDWYRDDELLRSSREVEVVAHEGGFRVWDALAPNGGGFEPGTYRVVLRTTEQREFGSARLELR